MNEWARRPLGALVRRGVAGQSSLIAAGLHDGVRVPRASAASPARGRREAVLPQSALIGAFLAGLLGGVHCLAMCGGWVALASRPPAAAPLVPAGTLRAGLAASHAGRLTTYVVLGALFGAAGGAALAATLAPLQRGLYVAANLLLLLLGASIALRGIRFAPLEQAGLAAFRRLVPAAARLAPARAGSAAATCWASSGDSRPARWSTGCCPSRSSRAARERARS